MTQPLTTTQGLLQWEKDLLTTRWRPEEDPTHTCLTPRGRAPYVCLRIRIVRYRLVSPSWVVTCLDCSWTESHDIAQQAANSGRVHTANHGGRS